MQKSFKKLWLAWKIIPGYSFEPFYENVHYVHVKKDTNNFFPSVMKVVPSVANVFDNVDFIL